MKMLLTPSHLWSSHHRSNHCHGLFWLILVLLLSQLAAFSASSSKTTKGVSIRPVILTKDLPSIKACRALAFPKKKSMLRSERQFVEATAVVKGSSQCLVAVDDKTGEICGTADYRIRRKTLTINNVFVAPNGRGKGIGRALMEELEEKGRKVGDAVLSLEVYTSNIPAIKLYRSCGYETNGIHRFVEIVSNVTGAGLLVEMSKTL